MNFYKKLILGAMAAIAFSAPVHANVNVGGVVWDPNYVAGPDKDFISQFNFTQWFTNTATLPNNLNYGAAVGINTVLASLGGSGATGYFLQGAGLVYRVDDASNNIAAGFGGPNTFCPGCQLTYAFGGIGLNKDSTFNLSQAWVRIYVDTTTAATTPVTSQAVANTYDDGLVWLDLSIASLSFRSGSTVQGGFVDANFNIIGGLAAGSFDPKSLTYAASAQFQGSTDKYSTGGNGSILGKTIPEPGTLALLALGLIAAATLRRRNI
ncbi:PEP-CTERM sorting domain-containing protein [Undibacterium sp.]|jgi:hypothetical protein|uniref:PEP-CTERM sorting domain-containing protein n=1 Tax=Undibacterium sp. TaxID=1914977 RepID=UPI002CB8500E|nr:PEP-CTERM sorting domain-containing protein [Undibacterium sp.]HTD03155.1 PEP-CTERM sorting domain-containing protein [Undibacterium sp.]